MGVASPGHKLGQVIGIFFESYFAGKLKTLAEKHEFYLDNKGLRPGVRDRKKKVTWVDDQGNDHDMDYVFERGGTVNTKGEPVSFVELAWRRYTKHSRNKAGEIEGALIHLGRTYRNSVAFLGAIIGGEFTEGALEQLKSRGINILYIPFKTIADSFSVCGIDLNYDEDAADDEKRALLDQVNALKKDEWDKIEKVFSAKIKKDYDLFCKDFDKSVTREIDSIIITGLYGDEKTFIKLPDSIQYIKEHDQIPGKATRFSKYDIIIKYSNGDKIDASFKEKENAIKFLSLFTD